uniref:Putative lipocalin-3 1 n=1 Tax=Rhipicephalus microplus TaxID=6941 RepID=A0A6M2D001_RHIMP
MLVKRAHSRGLLLLVLHNLFLGSIGNNIQTGENFDGSLDLIKVVNTSEYLWLYCQTYSNAFEVSSGKNNFLVETTCIRRIKTGLSKEEYNFTEIDIMELTNIGGNYTGRFIYENNTKTYFTKSPTSMTVFQEGAKDPDYVTVLEYTDPDTYYCSVFTVYFLENKITDDFDKCEMYIRNSHLLMGPTQGCKEFFEKKCTGRWYKPYDTHCINKGNENIFLK